MAYKDYVAIAYKIGTKIRWTIFPLDNNKQDFLSIDLYDDRGPIIPGYEFKAKDIDLYNRTAKVYQIDTNKNEYAKISPIKLSDVQFVEMIGGSDRRVCVGILQLEDRDYSLVENKKEVDRQIRDKLPQSMVNDPDDQPAK